MRFRTQCEASRPLRAKNSRVKIKGRHSLGPGVFGVSSPVNAFAGQLRLACSGLELDIGPEPDLAFPLSQQSILSGPNHAAASETRALDLGVGTAPNRVIPHVFKF